MIRLTEIADMVAKAFDLSLADMLTKNRDPNLFRARMVAAYVMRTVTGSSTLDIAVALEREHTTVLHNLRHAREAMAQDILLRQLVRSLVIAAQYKVNAMAVAQVDVLRLAKRITHNPQRQAVRASVHDVTALAVTFIDVWEILSATERLLLEFKDASNGLADPKDAARFEALRAAILDEINLIGGPADDAARPAQTVRQTGTSTETTKSTEADDGS